MKYVQSAFILLLLVVATGCFHTKVTTGLTPGATVFEKPWAHSFIGGLVPPSEIDGAAKCPSGVAIVETQQSFLNLLAGGFTFGIYSPMHITVTCAASGTASVDLPENEVTIAAGASSEEVVDAFDAAVDSASRTGRPVMVRFADVQP